MATMDNGSSMLSVALRDGVDSAGRIAVATRRDPLEGSERLVDESITMLVWGFGVGLLKKLYNNTLNTMGQKGLSRIKLAQLDMDVLKAGPQKLSKKLIGQYMGDQKSMASHLAEVLTNPKLVRAYQGSYIGKLLFCTFIPSALVGFGLPRYNAMRTRKKLAAEKAAQEKAATPQNPSTQAVNWGQLAKLPAMHHRHAKPAHAPGWLKAFTPNTALQNNATSAATLHQAWQGNRNATPVYLHSAASDSTPQELYAGQAAPYWPQQQPYHLQLDIPNSGETPYHLQLGIPNSCDTPYHLQLGIPNSGDTPYHLQLGIPNSGQNTSKAATPAITFGAGTMDVIYKLLKSEQANTMLIDGTITTGRVTQERNLPFRLETLFKEAALIYFYFFGQQHIKTWFEKRMDRADSTLKKVPHTQTHLPFASLKKLHDLKATPEAILKQLPNWSELGIANLDKLSKPQRQQGINRLEKAVFKDLREYVSHGKSGNLLYDLALAEGLVPTRKTAAGKTLYDVTQTLDMHKFAGFAEKLQTMEKWLKAMPQNDAAGLSHLLKRSLRGKTTAWFGASAICSLFMGWLIPIAQQQITVLLTGQHQFPGRLNGGERQGILSTKI